MIPGTSINHTHGFLFNKDDSDSSCDEDFRGFVPRTSKVSKENSTKSTESVFKLLCHDCDTAYPISELNMDKTTYYVLLNMADWGSRWHCSTCLNGPKSLNSNYTSDKFELLSKKIDEMKIDLKQEIISQKQTYANVLHKNINGVKIDLQKEITSQKKSYADAIQKNIEASKQSNDAINSINKNLNAVKSNIASKMDLESEDIAKKKKSFNVCIFNVPEPESLTEDTDESRSEDVKKVKAILDKKLNLEKDHVQNFFRRGNPANASKPRPIIMRLSNLDIRGQLLKLRYLNLVESDKKHNIFIHPDRTKKEQELHRSLVKELREKRSTSEENWMIKNGKVVSYQPFRNQPQFCWG